MTSRERAEKLARDWSETKSSERPMADDIYAAIEGAVLKEREACCQIALLCEDDTCADMIRERDEQ
jgi:hypothetical protein